MRCARAHPRGPDGGPDRGEAWRDAVASLGWRPTFDGRDLVLEVHLFDYEADLYGQWLCCAFVERLRDEERFETRRGAAGSRWRGTASGAHGAGRGGGLATLGG